MLNDVRVRDGSRNGLGEDEGEYFWSVGTKEAGVEDSNPVGVRDLGIGLGCDSNGRGECASEEESMRRMYSADIRELFWGW